MFFPSPGNRGSWHPGNAWVVPPLSRTLRAGLWVPLVPNRAPRGGHKGYKGWRSSPGSLCWGLLEDRGMGPESGLTLALLCWAAGEVAAYPPWDFSWGAQADPHAWSWVEDPQSRAVSAHGPVWVQCQEAQLVVSVHRDLFGTGRLVNPADLTLGPAACKHSSLNPAQNTVTFTAGLHECGSIVQVRASSAPGSTPRAAPGSCARHTAPSRNILGEGQAGISPQTRGFFPQKCFALSAGATPVVQSPHVGTVLLVFWPIKKLNMLRTEQAPSPFPFPWLFPSFLCVSPAFPSWDRTATWLGGGGRWGWPFRWLLNSFLPRSHPTPSSTARSSTTTPAPPATPSSSAATPPSSPSSATTPGKGSPASVPPVLVPGDQHGAGC